MTFEQFWQQVLVAWPFVLSSVPLVFLAGKYYGKVGKIDPEPQILEEVQRLEEALSATQASLESASTKLRTSRSSVKELKNKLEHHEAVRDALLGEENELWRLKKVSPPADYWQKLSLSRTRIVTVANLKGGVGKTTLSSNLCAYFSKKLNKRVLAIDLDYQGSLSAALLNAAGQEFRGSQVDRFLSGTGSGNDLLEIATPIHNVLPGVSILSSGYRLARQENRLMIGWLLEEIGTDIRYHLGNILLSDAVQENFDVVIIDAPPRMTTGAINALAASHHVIVPTIPDMMSSEPVGQFAKYIGELKAEINPQLNFAGVVVNLTQLSQMKPLERRAIQAIVKDLHDKNLSPHIFEQNIPRQAAIAAIAGEDVAYLSNRIFREGIMDHLGAEIAQRTGIQVPQAA